MPRTVQGCFFVVGGSRSNIAFFLPVTRVWWPGVISSYPKCCSFRLDICAFLGETQHPLSARRWSEVTESLSDISFVGLQMKTSTYWITVPGGRDISRRSLLSTAPSKWVLSPNPCGETVQVNWAACGLECEAHSKADSGRISSLRGMQEKGSFKSSAVNQFTSPGTWVRRVYGFGSMEQAPLSHSQLSNLVPPNILHLAPVYQ